MGEGMGDQRGWVRVLVGLGGGAWFAPLFGGWQTLPLGLSTGQAGAGVGLFHLAAQFLTVAEDAPQRGLGLVADAEDLQGGRIQGGQALPAPIADAFAAAKEVGQMDEGG